MDKILRIQMGPDHPPKAVTEPIGDYAGFGGRGMTSAVVAKEVPPGHDIGRGGQRSPAPVPSPGG